MKKFLGRHWNRLALGFLAAGASTAMAAVPQVSPLSLGSLEIGKPVEAKLSMTLNGQQLECSGKVTLASFSILTCGGEQRLAQVEFQSFNENKDAVVAVYQSGNQEGYLYLARLEGQTYTLTSQLVIITPGFGSVKLFSKYIYEPMKNGGVSDAQMFSIIPQMAEGLGAEFKLASLRDRVTNREYSKYVTATEPKAESKEEIKTEEKKAEEAAVKDPAIVKVDDKQAEEAKAEETKAGNQKAEEKKAEAPVKKTEEVKKERNLLPKDPVKKPVAETATEKTVQKEKSIQKNKKRKPKKETPVVQADPNEVVVDQFPSAEQTQTLKRRKQRDQERPQRRLSKSERKRLEERAFQRQRNRERQELLESTPTFQSESDDLFGVPDWD